MAFTAVWSQEVRDAIEHLALSPERPTAKAIHNALAVGAINGITGDMVPPAGTVARWVSDHRRLARETVGQVPEDKTVTQVLVTLRRRLKTRANTANTSAEIHAAAKAARELLALERDVHREPPKPKSSARSAPPATPDPPESQDDRAAFLATLD